MKLDAKIPKGPLAEKWDRHRFACKLVNPANKRKYDIIVVGGGLAGASAAASSRRFVIEPLFRSPEGSIGVSPGSVSQPDMPRHPKAGGRGQREVRGSYALPSS
jgi:hypothetical protein